MEQVAAIPPWPLRVIGESSESLDKGRKSGGETLLLPGVSGKAGEESHRTYEQGDLPLQACGTCRRGASTQA